MIKDMYTVTIFTIEPGYEYRTNVNTLYEIETAVKLINESRSDIVIMIGDVAFRAGDFKALVAKKKPEGVPTDE